MESVIKLISMCESIIWFLKKKKRTKLGNTWAKITQHSNWLEECFSESRVSSEPKILGTKSFQPEHQKKIFLFLACIQVLLQNIQEIVWLTSAPYHYQKVSQLVYPAR